MEKYYGQRKHPRKTDGKGTACHFIGFTQNTSQRGLGIQMKIDFNLAL
jgi:hypothetical protein